MMKAWPKVTWSDSAQILELMDVEIDGGDRVLPEPQEHFEALVTAGRLREAAEFIAHALPRYEGIVWAVQTLLVKSAIDRSSPLVVAILRWVDNPDDERRRAVYALTETAHKNDPAKMIGMGVFMSGGSISEPDLAPVLAPHGVSAKFAAAAVLGAAYATQQPDDILSHAAEVGRQTAAQGQ